MSDQPRNFLKVFPRRTTPISDSVESSVEWLATLCSVFQQATGWPLHYSQHANDTAASWSADLGGGKRLILGPPPQQPARVELNDATELAAAVAAGVGELQRAVQAVRQRDAELATAIPVAQRPDEQEHLAERLQAVLGAGAEAVGCCGAALYMLNDDTSELKLRAAWGLPRLRHLDPPRPLHGALADLEALIGHAVVLDDIRELDHWKTPEEFPAAVCVPISSPSTPLGTVWFFADQPREFSSQQTNVLEVVAGRLSAELERQVLLHESARGRTLGRQWERAAQWQDNRLPRIKPLLDDWAIAGWTAQGQRVGGDFFDWSVLPCGRLSLAVGGVPAERIPAIEDALTAATVQTALRSHSAYPHSARQLLARINETVWSSSTGDQLASLLVSVIEPESGVAEIAAAGTQRVWFIGPNPPRVWTPSHPLLGSQEDDLFPPHTETIEAGETMILSSHGIHWSEAVSNQLRETLSGLHDRHPDEVIDIARHQLLAAADAETPRDQTLVVVKRLRS